MVNELANILKQKLQPLSFIDKLAGLVRVQIQSTEGGKVLKYPVSCDVDFSNCATPNTKYLDLVPNQNNKCIVYFEDYGITQATPRIDSNISFVARFKIVGWVNQKKLGLAVCSPTSMIVAAIIKQLDTKMFNSGMYQFIDVTFEGQDAKHNTNPFSKYSYDEAVMQYIMYPFDYFSLNYSVHFDINPACLNDLITSTEIPC